MNQQPASTEYIDIIFSGLLNTIGILNGLILVAIIFWVKQHTAL